MPRLMRALLLSALLAAATNATAQVVPSVPVTPTTPVFDAELAKRLGADERGMRQYVLVILKKGPTRFPNGDARNAMFAGHFANIERLSKAGKLVLAGPLGKNPGGWRGLYVFATGIQEAKSLIATDPVIVNGEMVTEYHRWYGSAATMLLPELHGRPTPPAAAGGG